MQLYCGLVVNEAVVIGPWAGQLAIVRDIDVVIPVGAGSAGIIIQGSGGVPFTVFSEDATDGYLTAQWQGRQVIPEGDTVGVEISGEAWVTISGYLLTA